MAGETPLPTNPIDLITIDELADWGNVPTAYTTNENYNVVVANILQETITGFSQTFLWMTGRTAGYFTGNGSGGFQAFTETRNGNGSRSMGVLNGPINSVTTVQVGPISYPESVSWNQGGWFVAQGGEFISLRSGTSGFPSGFPIFGPQWFFTPGVGNVTLEYTGGYETPPYDVVVAALKACTVIISKRLREDEGARSTPQTGSISNFRAWKWPPEVQQTIENYRRTIMNWP